MNKPNVTAWLKTAPGIVVSLLVATTMLMAFGGKVLDVFRTPARVDAVEIEVRGHHDTIQTVYRRSASIDSVHAESHEIQEQLVLIRLGLCGLNGRTVRECIEEVSNR